jgi:integrase
MPLATNVFLRGSRYCFRIRVPRDLHRTLILRKELKRSLLTGDRVLARRRGARAYALALALFEDVRRHPMRTRQEIEAIIRRFYEAKLDELLHTWGGPPKTWEELQQLVEPEETPASRGETLAFDVETRDATAPRNRLPELQRLLGVEIGPDEERFFLTGMMRVLQELARADQSRRRGQLWHQSLDPLFAPHMIPLRGGSSEANGIWLDERPLSPHAHLPVSAIFERYKAEKAMPATTLKSVETAVNLFIQSVGDKPMREVTAQDFINFKDLALKTPVRYMSRFNGRFRKLHDRDITAREAADENAKRKEPFPTLGIKAVRETYLTLTRTFLSWAVENRHLRKDDFSVTARGDEAPRRPQYPFSPADLRKFFNAPQYLKHAEPVPKFRGRSGVIRDLRHHLFWLPLLAAFTGARIDELCALRATQVAMHEKIWCFEFTSRIRGKKNQPARRASRGSPASTAPDGPAPHFKSQQRVLAIHPELLRMGILDHAKKVREAGEEMLFPTLTLSSDKSWSANASKTLNRMINKIFDRERGLVFHSFRHAYKNALREADINQETQDLMMGHAITGIGGKYGDQALLKRQLKFIRRIKYEGLTLSHLSLK